MIERISLNFWVVALLLLVPSLGAQDIPAAQTPLPSPMGPPEELHYFSIEHRTASQIAPEDAALIRSRTQALHKEAEFYGYDIGRDSWSYEQAVCPMMPDYLMLQYRAREGSGVESRFTALLPRGEGRVRIVPVLHHNASRFTPAPSDPRNYRIFASVIPADQAKEHVQPESKWLTLSVCYAEMTNGHLEVLKNPQADLHMLKAPPPTLRIAVDEAGQEVRFVEQTSQTEYRLWEIAYDGKGRILSASDKQYLFGGQVINHPAPVTPTLTPEPPQPPMHPMPK